MDANQEAAKRVGTTLRNKWTLEKLLGVGGMAAVYVASHEKIGRREAIKILHTEVANSPDLRARFEQEARVVNRFKHPGAVEIRDHDVTEDGAPFLVMELLEGESLGDRARRLKGIELGELLGYVDELLDVLAAAHDQGIVHRDIKLDNLFILHDGHLKVLDFGIARMRDSVPGKLRTLVGTTLGTTPYMPPEQIRGHDIDGRADLFAVGATMFRLIAKRRVHEADSEFEMRQKMARDPAPRLASVAPHAPRDVCLVVDRALRFDRDDRYPSALTMQADVRAVRAGLPPPYATQAEERPEPTLSEPRANAGATAKEEDLRDAPTAKPGHPADIAPAKTAPTAPSLLAAAIVPAATKVSVAPDGRTPAEVKLNRGAGPVGTEATLPPAAPPSQTLKSAAVGLPPGIEASRPRKLHISSGTAPTPRVAPPAGAMGVPRTQPSGDPSVRVVEPTYVSGRSDTGARVLKLVLFGVFFAALGVAVTLWAMKRMRVSNLGVSGAGIDPGGAPNPPARAPAPRPQPQPRPEPIKVTPLPEKPNPTPVAPQQPIATQQPAQIPPAPTSGPPGGGPPGKGKGKGKGKDKDK